MRSHRHQPCLMVSPSQSAVLVPKLRLLGLHAVVAFILFFCHPQPEPRHPTRNKLPWTTSWRPERWPPNALLGRSTNRKLARGLHNLVGPEQCRLIRRQLDSRARGQYPVARMNSSGLPGARRQKA